MKSKMTPGYCAGMICEEMIYPIFLPNAGCPLRCIYCNQRVVVSNGRSERNVLDLVRLALGDYTRQICASGRSGEIAFFGGTFTALPVPLLESILVAASSAIAEGIFTGVRFSTRPDCLGDKVVELLSKYPVRTVELGVQSLSDFVLQKSRRGYDTGSVHDAAWRVREKGWKLGIQLMAGLPGDSREIFMESMRKAIEIGADFFRIYPTIVLKGTVLADLYREGIYEPLGLDEAVDWVAPAYEMALGAGIPVIRMGLQPDPALEEPGVILAGPYHPAFGCLVKSRSWRERADRHFSLPATSGMSKVVLRVAPSQVGDAIGHGKSNVRH